MGELFTWGLLFTDEQWKSVMKAYPGIVGYAGTVAHPFPKYLANQVGKLLGEEKFTAPSSDQDVRP